MCMDDHATHRNTKNIQKKITRSANSFKFHPRKVRLKLKGIDGAGSQNHPTRNPRIYGQITPSDVICPTKSPGKTSQTRIRRSVNGIRGQDFPQKSWVANTIPHAANSSFDTGKKKKILEFRIFF